MKYTKIEKLNMVKEIVANAQIESAELKTELVDTIAKEIESVSNKYETAKLKKENKKNEEYGKLEPMFLTVFEQNPDKALFNDDFNFDNMSTSKKTVVLTRLINKGLVRKIAPKGKVKKVSYELVATE